MRSICQKANNLFHRSLGSSDFRMKTVILFLTFYFLVLTLSWVSIVSEQ